MKKFIANVKEYSSITKEERNVRYEIKANNKLDVVNRILNYNICNDDNCIVVNILWIYEKTIVEFNNF